MSVLEGPRREVRHVVKDGSADWVEFKGSTALRSDRDHRRSRELHLALLRVQQHAYAAKVTDLLPEAGFAASPDSDGVRRVALGNEERLPDRFKTA